MGLYNCYKNTTNALKKIPRPMNCFFIYRREKQQELQLSMPGEDNQIISVLIGNMWKKEPESVKQLYKSKANQEKLIHNSLYPDYKYVPRRNSKKDKTNRKPTNLLVPPPINTSLTNSSNLLSPTFYLNDAETHSLHLPPLRHTLDSDGNTSHNYDSNLKFQTIEPYVNIQPTISNYTFKPF